MLLSWSHVHPLHMHLTCLIALSAAAIPAALSANPRASPSNALRLTTRDTGRNGVFQARSVEDISGKDILQERNYVHDGM